LENNLSEEKKPDVGLIASLAGFLFRVHGGEEGDGLEPFVRAG